MRVRPRGGQRRRRISILGSGEAHMSADDETTPTSVLVVLEPSVAAPPEEAAHLSVRLRRELRDLDASVVAVPSGAEAPTGAKGIDVAQLGAFLVTLSSGGVLAHLVAVLRDWVKRQNGDHTVSVTIDGDKISLSRATAQEQASLVQAYVRRHRGK
jgi:Effector Associated Constant Component 1